MTKRIWIGMKLATSVSLAALAMPAWAQDSDEIIVTAQRNNQTEVTAGGNAGVLGNKKAEDLPFSIKSYNSALILNQQPQTLGQVLENDPSVRTTYGFGNAAEQFVIRGFTLYGDDVGLDGLYGIAPRQLIAPELYDSVQVLNGASAFLNGAAPGGSGLGGSGNLLPKRAGLQPLQRVTLNYTSKEHFGGSFDVSRRFGDFGVRINGVAREGDVATDNEFRSTYTFGTSFDYDNGPLRMSLDLAYQRIVVRSLRPKVELATSFATGAIILDRIPDVPDTEHNYAQPFSYSNLRDIFGVAKIEYDLSDEVMLYASAGARDGSEYGVYDGIIVNDAQTGAATGNDLYVPRTDNNEAVQAGVRVKLAGAGMTHEFNLGGTASWQVNRNAFDFLYNAGFAGYATNLYNTPNAAYPQSAFVGGDLSNPFPRSRSKFTSFFASDTVGLFNDQVLITGGLRIQKILAYTYSYNGDASLGIAKAGVETKYRKDTVSPVVGIVVKPVAGVSLFANRIEGLLQGDTAANDPGIVNRGQQLEPVKSTQYEVGGKFRVGTFDISLAAYRIERPISYVVGGVFGTFGQQRNQGIEFNVTGEPTKGLRVIAGGTVVDAKLRRNQNAAFNGNMVTGIPEYTLNANLEWDLPFVPALTLTGRVIHTGEQAVNNLNQFELPTWTRVDLGARYVAVISDKPLTFRFNVDNVGNERYWASAFDTTTRPQLLQGAPRTYKASVSIDF